MAGYMDFNLGNLGSPQQGGGGLDYLSSLQVAPTSMSDSIMNSLKGFGGGFFDKTNAAGIKDQGWGSTALGVASGLGNAYMGMQQYGLAKDQLNFSKQQYETNLKNQTKLTNASLADRQASRVASNPSAYQSVGDYIKQYGV